MKKSCKNLLKIYLEGVNRDIVYFSETVPDARYKNYKYFFKYHNTHNVAQAFKTQKEVESFIKYSLSI